jgi:hypothetical protein
VLPEPEDVISTGMLRAMSELAAPLRQIKKMQRIVHQEEDWHLTIVIRPRAALPAARTGRQASGQAADRHAGNGQADRKVPAQIRAAFIDAVGADTVSAKELARRLGRSYSGHFRQNLAALRADGTLHYTDDGYTAGDIDE